MEGFYMFGKEKKEKRFVVKEEQTLLIGAAVYIVVDIQTGVNYLMTVGNGLNGITPLLDSNGSVVIDR
jgi:hypothetical protein